MRGELKLANELALHDALTGLLSRYALHVEVQKTRTPIAPEGNEQRRSAAPRCNKGVLMLDLMGFKAVNDTLGHHAGDDALKAVAKSVLKSTRDEDKVFRNGGDEFVIILDNVDIDEITSIAKRIVNGIENLPNLTLSGRIGGVAWDTARFPEADLSDVIGAADSLEVTLREDLIARTRTAKIDIREYVP